MIKKIKNFVNKYNQKKNFVLVELDQYIFGKIQIDKKDIHDYIKGFSVPLLGYDFYYCYIYDGNMLSFISGKNKSFVEDCYALAGIALMQEGKYYIKDKNGDFYYLIEHKTDEINTFIVYEKPTDAIEITPSIIDIKEMPKTLKLKWSLHQKENIMIKFLVVLFIVLFAVNIFMVYKYQNTLNALEKQVLFYSSTVKEQPTKNNKNIDLINEINKIGSLILGKGIIDKVEKQNNSLIFYITFKSEEYAIEFLKTNGGKYEQGKVIYSVNIAGM